MRRTASNGVSTERLVRIQALIDEWNEYEIPSWVSNHVADGFVLSVYQPEIGSCNLWHFCDQPEDDMPAHHVDLSTWACRECKAIAPISVRAAFKLIDLEV